MDQPYLSVVVTSRNDDHGGSMLARMQCFIDALATQANSFELTTELLVVEWNPPSEGVPLLRALSWPNVSSFFATRIITVPSEIHAALDNSSRLGLFQMIAKNVGVARANGKFILVTNIDILFSENCFSWLATKPLHPGKSYRADRLDVPADTVQIKDLTQCLAYCEKSVIAAGRHGEFEYDGIDGAGIASRSRYQRAARRLRSLLFQTGIDRYLGRSSRLVLLRRMIRYLCAKVCGVELPKLHTIACGDFALMSKEDWEALSGYEEWPIYSWNLDSLLLYLAHASGMEEVLLGPEKSVYHIDHSVGSGWTPGGDAALFKRLEENAIPYMDDVEMDLQVRNFLREGGRQVPPTNWGMKGAHLPEILAGLPTKQASIDE